LQSTRKATPRDGGFGGGRITTSPVRLPAVLAAPDDIYRRRMSQEPSGLVLEDGDAKGMRVEGARQAGEAFERARLVDVDLVRCDLSGCDFSETIWHRVTLTDCRCSSVELGQATLRDVTFADCKLD